MSSSSSQVLGKRKNSDDSKESFFDMVRRELQAPRTHKRPRLLPRGDNDTNQAIKSEETLLELGNFRNCKDRVVFFYNDPPRATHIVPLHWCHVHVEEVQAKIWDLMTDEKVRGDQALQGNFLMEDMPSIQEFVQTYINGNHDEIPVRKAFLEWLKEEGKFVDADYDDYTPKDATGIFFITLRRNTFDDDDDTDKDPQLDDKDEEEEGEGETAQQQQEEQEGGNDEEEEAQPFSPKSSL